MTTLMQANRQWSSRAPDERFTSLIGMQSFKRRVREQRLRASHSSAPVQETVGSVGRKCR